MSALAMWVVQAELICYTGHSTAISLFFHVATVLFLLALGNLLLKKFRPSWALSGGELLTIYVMLSVAGTLCSHDLLQVLIPMLSHVSYGATPQNRWAVIRGRAVWLDQRRNYTPDEPLHGAPVFLKTGLGGKHLLGTRALTPVMTDADGRYTVSGLIRTAASGQFRNAESTVYAIVGAGMGYLLGQTSAKMLQTTGMLSGLTLNYTAGSTVFVTSLAMVMVFLSAIYPARKAFRAAIPDVEKEQDADSEAIGSEADAIAIYLPFVANAEHVEAMQAYLAEFLESVQGVTVGQLAVDNLQAVREAEGGEPVPTLRFRAWMAPFDLGVSHDAEIRIVYRVDRGVHQYHLTARRFSGDRQNWHRLTPRFIAAIRKQLLLWRVLSADEYEKYQQRGKSLFGGREKVNGQ